MLTRIDALTPADKAEIKEMSKEARLEVKFASRCKDCYKDALLMLRLKYGVNAENGEKALTPSGNFRWLHGATKVVWFYKLRKIELSAQTDDATIEKYIAFNPSQKHFERVESAKEKGGDND